MSSVLEILGIDPEELEWYNLAMCKGLDREDFYDNYESNETVAKITDQVCLSCPVLKECLTRGIENGEHGVWGGIFLTNGRPDMARNAHKTEEVWEELKERIGDLV